MKQIYFRHLCAAIALAFIAPSGFIANAEEDEDYITVSIPQIEEDDHHTIVSIPVVEKFSNIKIIDATTRKSLRFSYGYPGIWIKETDQKLADVSFNELCSEFVQVEVVDATLVLSVDLSFLSPAVTNWYHGWGIIDAITINVPSQYNLKSIENQGPYNLNMTLWDIKAESLSVTSSNRTNMSNCHIDRFNWTMIQDQPLAKGCNYNISLKESTIGRLVAPAEYSGTFRLVKTPESVIKKFDWQQK